MGNLPLVRIPVCKKSVKLLIYLFIMVQIFIQILIALWVSITLYVVSLFAKKHPNIIAGFKWSSTPEGIELDKQWLKIFYRIMTLASIITLIGSIIGILFKSNILFILFLSLPSLFSSIYIATLRSKMQSAKVKHNNRRKSLIITTSIVVLFSIPFFYPYCKDLNVIFKSDHLEITGIYGTTIEYDSITQIQLLNSLPHISYRSNGYSIGPVNLGNFKGANGNILKLFTHSDSCFICIKSKNNIVYYMSKKQHNDTKILYENIVKHMNHKIKMK